MTSTSKEVIVLIPVSAMPLPSKTYKNPLIEDCPSCGDKVWMSDKKRQFRDMGYECLCYACAVKKYGRNYEVINLAKTN